EGTVSINATPNGGTFSGPGMTGNTFDPSVGTGTYSIVYNYTDGNGCSNSDSIVMKVSECTGLTDQANLVASLQVYPNPAKDVVVVKSELKNAKLLLVISDATGRVVSTETIDSNEEKVNISGFANGVYLLSIKEGNTLLRTIKLIKE
ncbi:MAG: T9SS type A sorting domain-containing protein, partial [Sphingobacteriaceae bacterium]